MAEIIKEIMKDLPADKISEANFEAANIVLYTKDKDFFLNNNGLIKKIVDNIKKRVELRPDPSITMDMEDAEKEIKKIIPEEAGVDQVIFDPQRSRVIIEAEKPGLAIGKQGAILRDIRSKTLWVPLINRKPALRSKLIETIRAVLYQNSDYRRKFLDKVGHRIYDGWMREKKEEWIRISYLGSARQVGRSCLFLQTPESRVLLDCGVDVASEQQPYPYLEAPEFHIDDLDAVIVTHAHIDHSGFVPYLFKMGYTGPVYCSVDYNEPVIFSENGNIKKDRIGAVIDRLIRSSKNIENGEDNEYICASVEKDIKVPAFSQKDYKINFKKVKKVIRHKVTDKLYEIKVKTGRKVKVTGSHSIFVLKDGTIKTIKVEQLCVGDYLVSPHRMPDVGLPMKMPEGIGPSPELMRILGYFTAEGHLENRSVRLTFGLKDKPYVDDFCRCVKKVFNVNCKVSINQATRLRVTFNSKKIRGWFANVFFSGYTKANSKHVPNIVFNANRELKLEYLKAYMAGDGYLNVKNKTVTANSVSKALISDLSYICTQLGFTYTLFDRIVPTAKTKARVYSITINLSDYNNHNPELTKNSCELLPLTESNFGMYWYYHRLKGRSHVTKQRLFNLLNKQYIEILESSQNGQLLIQNSLYKLANSDLSFLEVTDINLCEPTNGYVYDFSVEEDENFVGGEAPICLHNTEPTRDVMSLMLLDYVKIQKSDGKNPVFSTDDIKEMVKHTITLEYDEVTDVTPDVRITLYNAGHILGSAMVHLHVGNGLHNILYSGDQKYGRTMLLDPAVTIFPRLETLLLESTYGGKENLTPERQKSDIEFKQIVQETIKRGGKVLVPTLGVGRSQEIMVLIEDMVRTGSLDKIPVFIDGLIWDVTAIHTAYPEYLNNSIRKLIFHKDQNPFLSDIFKRVGSQEERMQIIEETGPCVILATSGMLVGGPSVEYLRHLADNPKNSMIFVNYQGEGSLGRRIQRGEREYTINSGNNHEVVQIKLEVHTVEGFSGHSSRTQLLSFVSKCEPRPKKIIINHGESSRCLDLASSLHKNFRIETVAPRNLESVRIK